jgi:hypothetical protein
VDIGHQGEQHTIKLTAIYSGRYFEDRVDDEWDHGILADVAFEYRLAESHVIRVNDNFTYSSEPTLLDRGTALTIVRADGSNLHNIAEVKYVGQLTELIGLELGYANNWYDFEQTGPGSYSALLDRTEHLFRAESRWAISQTLAGILGYWYESVGFNSDDSLSPFVALSPELRDSTSHYFVAGADYTVSPHCFISVRGGAQNVTYDNLPGEPDEWNGFADISSTFEYAEGSYFRVGGKYGRNRTDALAFLGGSNLTLDQESITVYGVISHKITEDLTARLSGQLQNGEFQGGGYDGDSELLYILGATLSYQINQYLALEAGYNYDRVDSDDPGRTYFRNRVFLGVRGQF